MHFYISFKYYVSFNYVLIHNYLKTISVISFSHIFKKIIDWLLRVKLISMYYSVYNRCKSKITKEYKGQLGVNDKCGNILRTLIGI